VAACRISAGGCPPLDGRSLPLPPFSLPHFHFLLLTNSLFISSVNHLVLSPLNIQSHLIISINAS